MLNRARSRGFAKPRQGPAPVGKGRLELSHAEGPGRPNGAASVDVVLDEMARAAGVLAGDGFAINRATIARVESGTFTPVSVADGGRLQGPHYPLESHPAIRKAVRTRKVAVCRTEELKSPAIDLITESGSRAIGCAPVWSGGELFGVLCISSKNQTFEPDQLDKLEAMGNLAGLAIRDTQSLGAERTRSGELRGQVSDLTLLLDTARKLAVSLNLEVILWEVATAAAEIAFPEARGRRRAEVLQLEAGKLTRVVVFDELGPDRTGVEFPLTSDPAIRKAVETGAAVTATAGKGLVAGTRRGGQATSTAYAPIPAGGRVFGVLAVSARDRRRFDGSQLRTLEGIAYLAGLAIGHARYVEQIHGLEAAKSQFLRLVAHDLRTPLGVVNGYLSMMQDDSIPATTLNRVLSIMRSKINEMNLLISQLLDIARLEDQKLQLKLQPIDLTKLVRAAVQTMTPVGDARSIVARHVTDGVYLLGDSSRITAIVVNLLENAIKYSPKGREIEYSLWAENGLAHVGVTDHGSGIKPEDIPILFTRFGRLPAAESSDIPGTGLGLYLARQLARMHGGDVTVSSKPGIGSTFIMTLPVGNLGQTSLCEPALEMR